MLSARNITLKCETVIGLAELEAVGIAYVRCCQVNGEDRPLLAYAGGGFPRSANTYLQERKSIMKKRKKKQAAAPRAGLQLGHEGYQSEMSIGEPIQETTMQIPVGTYSLVETPDVPIIARAVYMALCEFSNWESGKTHRISQRRLAKFLGTSLSHVRKGLKWLTSKGFVSVVNRQQGGGTVYQLTHHLCEPTEVPLDKDGLPKKCAVARGAYSPSEKLENGEISWKTWVAHITAQIHADDWTIRIAALPYQWFRENLKIGNNTIKQIKDEMEDVNLLKQLSGKGKTCIVQLLPKPYPERRERQHENPKAMRFDGEFYYSFNERWRIKREDAQIHTREGKRWRHATEYELERSNKKIYFDFMQLRSLVFPLWNQLSS